MLQAQGPAPRCLVAEDAVLVSMLIEDVLEEHGVEVACSVASGAEALAWLNRNTPDLALIDYQLADGPCTVLARDLRRRGIPFAVLSGSMFGFATPEFQGVPWLDKPASPEALARLVRDLVPVSVA